MGPKGFSLLLTGFGVGGLTGAGLMTWLTARAKDQLATLRRTPFAALLSVAGVSFISCNISVNSLLQLKAEDKDRGKISSLYILAMRGGAPLGSLLCGALATEFGIKNALIINASCALILWILLTYLDRTSLRERLKTVHRLDQSS